jgi:hypothetical protein
MNIMTSLKQVLSQPKQIDVRAEYTRRISQRQKILHLLRTKRDITNIDLQRIAFNYTMRISELRKDGHKIQAVYEKPGVFKYYYKGQAK